MSTLDSTTSTAGKAPKDQSVRQQALDPERSFIVQAPAGSGKTELLTRRVLTLLCTVDEPEQILAITFTRKAASEMRQRVVETLVYASGNPDTIDPYELEGLALARQVLERDAKSGWQLIRNPQRLNLSTIDSLATQLAHRLPVTSTLGAPTGLEEKADALYREAAGRFIQANLSSLGRVLLQLGNKLDRAQSLLAGLLAKRDQWKRHVYNAGSDHDQLRQILESMLGELVESRIENLCSLVPVGLGAKLLPCLKKAVEFALIEAEGDMDELCWEMQLWHEMENLPGSDVTDLELWGSIAFALLTTQNGVRKRLTKKEGFPPKGDAKKLGVASADLEAHKQSMQDALEMLEQSGKFLEALVEVRKLPAPFYQDEQWALLSQLLTVLPDLLVELQLVFAEQAKVDFGEISTRAALALGSEDAPTDLALSMDLSLKHLLIDEFQDTSQTQFKLFEQLLRPWENGDGRTFFAVGDPMQSIYRFREGDVALFSKVQREGIVNVQVIPLTLSVNFRAAPAVTRWVNSTFEKIFPEQADADSGAVPYSPSDAFLSHEGVVEVHPLIDADKTVEASCVAQLCNAAIDSDPAHKVAILVRSRAQAIDIFSALREADLPYESVDMDLVGERAVVRDLVTLTLALRYPHDRLHWLALLRAPFVALGLHDLHGLLGDAESKVAVIERLHDDALVAQLSQEGQCRIKRLLTVLQPAMKRAMRSRLMPWVEAVWLQLGGPVVCQSESDRDAAERALALLYQLEARGELWQKSVIEGALSGLYAAAAGASVCQIQVMTLHKSKGLEFDTVILPALDRRPRGDSTQLLNWFESTLDGRPQLLLAPFEQSGVHPSRRDRINKLVQRAADRCNDQEKLRLLYVACTRAKRQLHLVARASHNSQGKLASPAAASLLAPLWPLVQKEFESEAQQHTFASVITNSNLGSNPSSNSEPELSADVPVSESSSENEQISHRNSVLERKDADMQLTGLPDKPRKGQLDLLGFDVNVDEEHKLAMHKEQDGEQENEISPPDVITELSASTAPPFMRLPANVVVPEFTAFQWQVAPDQADEQDTKHIEFQWAGRDARDIGTVIHDQLQSMAETAIANEGLDEQLHRAIARRQLRNLGLNESRLELATDKVIKALSNTLDDERGRWILQAHAQARTEWALTVPGSTQISVEPREETTAQVVPHATVQQVIIDRTFVDEQGVRWIVDYKTGDHEGADVKAFLDAEQARYTDQLNRYADIMSRMDDRPVRVGLYFPMLKAWREWQPMPSFASEE